MRTFVVFLSMAIDKNAVIKEAQKYVTKGQFDKAIAEWKKLLRETPSDPNIYNTIGDLCLKKDARMEAVDAYKRAADILAADGFTSKAIALYKKILNIDHQQIDVHLALGDLNAEKGLTGAALESYKLIADFYIHEQDMVKALGIYQRMADLNPSNIAFRIKLGDMYEKEGMKADAAKAYLAAADAHVAKDAFQDARLLFEKILSLDPANKEVYHKAGLVYFREGKFPEACKALKPAFENDPSDRELADMYIEALSRAGKLAETQATLTKLIAEDQSRIDLREKLFNLYLENNDYEKALAEISSLAQLKFEADGEEAAEQIFKTFVSRNPDSAAGREKLGEFYASIDRLDEATQELLLAAKLHTETGDSETTKALLLRVLELAPGMPEAKKRLDQLEASLAPPPVPPIEEKYEAPAAAPQPPTVEFIAEQPSETPIAQPPVLPGEEDNPVISKAFTEADVLIKYGLPAKAAEQLEGLALQFPENVRLQIRLRDLYREQGNADQAIGHILLLADLYNAQGRNDMANTELQSALELAPNNPLVLSRLGITPVETQPSEVAPPEILLDQLDIASTVPPIPSSTFEETPPILEPTSAGEESIAFEETDSALPPSVEQDQPAEIAPPAEAFEVTEQPVASAALDGHIAEDDISEIWAEAEFYYQQGLFDEARKHYARIIQLAPNDRKAVDRLAEISREEDETREFTKLAEAVEGLEDRVVSEPAESALASSASDEEAVKRLMKEIAEINHGQTLAPPPSRKATVPGKPRPMQPTETGPKKEHTPTPQPFQREAPPQKSSPLRASAFSNSVEAPPKGKKSAAEDFFDLGVELQKEVNTASRERKKKPEDYFDLAAELRDELSAAPATTRSSVAPEDQSLDDIFEEFKKGVEQQSIKEDTDTHYNLGVAYKEMGLLDDAIAEFIMTPEGKPWFAESRYMLGLCYMEKTDYQNAINEIRNALKHAAKHAVDDQERLGMLFDLGLAYQGVGNIKAAISEFQKVADLDQEYRDVAAKLKELQQGEFISLAQLKDDIEKEISSKFLEEGERIERAEKSRRSDKLRE